MPMSKKFIDIKQRIFLIDGIGALLTAFLLLVFIRSMPHVFGVPAALIFSLAATAGIFAIYSFSCHFVFKTKKPIFLRILAILNMLYCMATTIFALLLNESTTTVGVIYFTGEILLILSLSYLEFRLAQK